MLFRSTYLGVDTSQVPTVVSDQLGLAKGFGLVVDYVEPNSPAATAGVQQNDILKMLNDQILIEPSQLRKLLQTFPEGTEVTLTVLRKGQEQKLTAKLVRKEVSQRRGGFPGGNHDWHWDFDATGDLGEQMQEQMQNLKEQLKEQLGDQRGIIRGAVMQAHEAARRARDDARHAPPSKALFGSRVCLRLPGPYILDCDCCGRMASHQSKRARLPERGEHFQVLRFACGSRSFRSENTNRHS